MTQPFIAFLKLRLLRVAVTVRWQMPLVPRGAGSLQTSPAAAGIPLVRLKGGDFSAATYALVALPMSHHS